MRTSLVFIFILLTVVTNAQTAEKTATPQETLTIKFPKFPIANFPENSIPVSGIRLIQNVKDSTNLGYALKGMTGRVVILKPAKPLTEFLQEHITRMYKEDYTKDGSKILWVLKDLRLGEKSFGLRYAYTRLNADAYISKEGTLFKKVYSVDTVFVTEGTELFTRAQGEDIETVFRFLAKKTFQGSDLALGQPTEERTIEQITDQSKQNLVMPILTDSVYNEGAYATFEEFIRNKPSVMNFESVYGEKNRIKFIKPGSDPQTDTLHIWGLCQKGDIYKYHEGYLLKIEKQGMGFIISSYVENTNRQNRSVFSSRMTGASVGGIAGGMIALSAFDELKSKQLLVKSIPYISDPVKQPLASCIDMKTGELSF